jgi:hypothetical protein
MRSMAGRGAWIAVMAAWAIGCGGSAQQQQEQRDAAAVAGVAAALQVVQTARAKAPAAGPSPSVACCAVCGPCEFPCGDTCVANGTMCLDPPGCACAGDSGEARDQPVQSEPPGGCPTPTPGIVVTSD